MPQAIDVPCQQVARSVGKGDREKERSTFDVGTSVAGHGRAGRVGTAEGRPPIEWESSAAVPTLQCYGRGDIAAVRSPLTLRNSPINVSPFRWLVWLRAGRWRLPDALRDASKRNAIARIFQIP